MSVELLYGLMAALPLLPFAIASRRCGWLGVAVGVAWLMWCWKGVMWPDTLEQSVIDDVGVTAELLAGLLYAGPMMCAGLYGLASNPTAKEDAGRVSVTA